MATTLRRTGTVLASAALLASLALATLAVSAMAEGSCTASADHVAGGGGSIDPGEPFCVARGRDIVPSVSPGGVFDALGGFDEVTTYLFGGAGDGSTLGGGWLASFSLAANTDMAPDAGSIGVREPLTPEPVTSTPGAVASDELILAPIPRVASGEQLADPSDDEPETPAPVGRRGGASGNLKK